MEIVSSQSLTQQFQFHDKTYSFPLRLFRLFCLRVHVKSYGFINNIHNQFFFTTMNRPFNLNQIASTIADLIKQGLDIRVNVQKDVFDIWNVVVCAPSNATSAKLCFNVADNEPQEQDNVDVDQSLFGRVTDIKPVALPTVKGVEAIAGKKKNSTWWSRYHFEANVMKMAWQSLHDQEP